jgi:hypothetical protein
MIDSTSQQTIQKAQRDRELEGMDDDRWLFAV